MRFIDSQKDIISLFFLVIALDSSLFTPKKVYYLALNIGLGLSFLSLP